MRKGLQGYYGSIMYALAIRASLYSNYLFTKMFVTPQKGICSFGMQILGLTLYMLNGFRPIKDNVQANLPP